MADRVNTDWGGIRGDNGGGGEENPNGPPPVNLWMLPNLDPVVPETDDSTVVAPGAKVLPFSANLALPESRHLKILDFDVECRPMAWYGDWVTKEITAIAWRFVDEPEEHTHSWILTPSRTFEQHQNKKRAGLHKFLKAWHQADQVTGHFIRGFDLPLINGTCIKLSIPPLREKMVHDTKNDLIVMQGLSKSQENLGAMLELEHKKVQMNTMKWEVANALVVEGRQAAKERVVGDVNQHIEFRKELLKREAMLPPRRWTPGSMAGRYVG